MAETKTGKIDGRTARARLTRSRIIEAATGLFTTAGYATTSVEAIAEKAGVGVQTVYYAFGTKRAILTEALDRAVAGDDEPVPTLERPWLRQALATPDPVDQLRLQVAGAAAIYARAAALLDVVRSAAATDPDLAQVWRTNLEQRHTVQLTLAEALAGKTTLRHSVDEAADIALAVLSPETYHLLVTGRAWTPQRWEHWACDALTCQLLDTSGSSPSHK
ncbi:TetR/AcrR family transcriptional regulator [Nonomuraea sp. NPDC049625]|uniref:TetR/AcrR family transcriptional regulator n=1 Tax=Nonomuraea sp. NPDC049625 TaxID=3155775 RepID=UPI00342F2F50